MYLIDTCVISEARRRTPQAVDWLAAAHPNALFLSAITIGEIAKGISIKSRNDPGNAAVFRRWLDELRLVFASRILPVDDAVATNWGHLMAARTRPMADALIAATARVNNKILVTRNVADFADMGIEIVNPWAI
jgi:predicted nucleic acid-binding protein